MFHKVSFERLIDWAVVALVIMSLIFLYFAQLNRRTIDSNVFRDKIELASIAAKEALLSDTKRITTELGHGAAWLASYNDLLSKHYGFVEHFSTLLVEDPLVDAVRIALENGRELAVWNHNREIISCLRFPEHSVEDTCIRWSLDAYPDIRSIGGFNRPAPKDPRSNPWFANAVRNSGIVSWTFQKRDSTHYLIGSMLISGQFQDDQLAVIAMELNASKLVSDIRTVPSRIEALTFLRLPDGTNLFPDDMVYDSAIQSLANTAVEHLGSDAYNRVLDMNMEGYHYKVGYRPIELDGSNPTLINIVPIESGARLWGLKRYIIIGLLLILSIAAVLFMGWRRRRGDSRKIMVHEARSKSQQIRLKQALDEREVLDREVHHRVKNNLQIISSLLNMQRMRLNDPETITTFEQSKERIEAIAQIHNALYQSKDLRGIDLQEFLESIVEWVHQHHAPEEITISYEVQANKIKADMDSALDIGIIVSELVTNCYQHAFPFVTGGHIDISVSNIERDRFRLVVQDNGRGMSVDLLETDKVNRLGLDLVEALVEGLDGTFSYRSDNGVYFEAVVSIVPRDSIVRPQ
jgi:two-component sensor histidine kinase